MINCLSINKDWGHLQFKFDSEVIANPKKACVTAYNTSRSYGRSSGNRAFGGKSVTMEQLKTAIIDHSLFNLRIPQQIFLDILKCVFSNGDAFALSEGGFMVSLTEFKLLEHIPALADKKAADCIEEAKIYCLQSKPDYEHCYLRNLGGDELDEENILMHSYIEDFEHLKFSKNSKVIANQPWACVTAYENSRQYVTFNSQVESSHKNVTTESVTSYIDLKIPIKCPVVVSSEVVRCIFSNGDNFAITPGGFMVSIINFKVMEHIPELADEKCLDLIYQRLWMKTPIYMTGKATHEEELILFRNYSTGERLQFEEGSKVAENSVEACVTAYNTSRKYGCSNGKQTSCNKVVTAKNVKSAEIYDLILIRGSTKNVMSTVVKCVFKNGNTFAITPGGFLASLNDFRIAEHVPALADNNCLKLIKAMKMYGVK